MWVSRLPWEMIGEAGRSVVGPLAKINRPALATLSELPPATP